MERLGHSATYDAGTELGRWEDSDEESIRNANANAESLAGSSTHGRILGEQRFSTWFAEDGRFLLLFLGDCT